jgi:hypothetical protein
MRLSAVQAFLHLLKLLPGNAHANRLPAAARRQKQKRRAIAGAARMNRMASMILRHPTLHPAIAALRTRLRRRGGRAAARGGLRVILTRGAALNRRWLTKFRARLGPLAGDEAIVVRRLNARR